MILARLINLLAWLHRLEPLHLTDERADQRDRDLRELRERLESRFQDRHQATND